MKEVFKTTNPVDSHPKEFPKQRNITRIIGVLSIAFLSAACGEPGPTPIGKWTGVYCYQNGCPPEWGGKQFSGPVYDKDSTCPGRLIVNEDIVTVFGVIPNDHVYYLKPETCLVKLRLNEE